MINFRFIGVFSLLPFFMSWVCCYSFSHHDNCDRCIFLYTNPMASINNIPAKNVSIYLYIYFNTRLTTLFLNVSLDVVSLLYRTNSIFIFIPLVSLMSLKHILFVSNIRQKLHKHTLIAMTTEKNMHLS